MSHRQLLAVGLGSSAISKRAAKGRLHRVHRGVYAVGHAGLSIEGRWTAAVLACGDGAVLSHGSAAALLGLLRPVQGSIDVTVPTRSGRRRRAGLRVHRVAGLTPRQCTQRKRIPVTTAARTIEDLAGMVPEWLVRRATRQAEIAGFPLGPGIETDGTRSDLETDFLALCRRHGLPRPEVNVRIGRRLVDFVWPAARLAVETDSYAFHRGSVAFEDDRARDLELRARGFEVHRFSELQVRNEPERVAADLVAALSRRTPASS